MTKRTSNHNNINLSDLLSPETIRLLEANGKDFVSNVGVDLIRGVVFDVLTGKNLRSSTERITRRRIADLNLAMLKMFIDGSVLMDDFVEKLPYLATDILTQNKLSKTEKWLAQWSLGLTGKSVQNVLRDDTTVLLNYRDEYIQTCKSVIENYSSVYGDLYGQIKLSKSLNNEIELNWLFVTYLLNSIGSQTLTIRGSEKSAYGKLFEKLVLGSLLHILGFQYVRTPSSSERSFWLSSRGERRESDATLLYRAGNGVRFDIGFIGRGNPEISLDKVTRFEHEAIYGDTHWYLATIIIVDTIGAGSRIKKLAENVNGTIIQMSASYWPQQIAQKLQDLMGYDHEILHLKHNEIDSFIKNALMDVPLELFIGEYENLNLDDSANSNENEDEYE